MSIVKPGEWTRRRILRTLGAAALSPAIAPGELGALAARQAVQKTAPKATAKPAAKSPVPFSHFVDVAATAGLTQTMFYGDNAKNTYIIEVNGAGCAFFDYDNDGWM